MENNFEILKPHSGHVIEISATKKKVTVECISCGELLLTFEKEVK